MPLPMLRFDCTECARCCRSLVDKAAKRLPETAEAMARAGFYPVPRIGGLQVWSWERHRMLEAARQMGEHLPFQPALGVVDERSGRFVVLLWELTVNECPLVRGNHCGAYEARPLVCRAYPLILQGSDIVISSLCPGAVYKETPAEIEAYLYHAYRPCAEAASTSGRIPRFCGTLLQFLETAGAIRMARGLALEAAAEVAAAAPVDFTDFLVESGVLSREALEARVAELGERARVELAAKYAAGA